MHELTLEFNEVIRVGEEVVITLLPKEHPLAMKAQVARFGIDAPQQIHIPIKKTKI